MADEKDVTMADAVNADDAADETVPAAGDAASPAPVDDAASPGGGDEGEEEKEEAPFEWRITNFSKITDLKLFSEPFEMAGHKWRILLFPKGNKVDCLSIYTEVYKHEELPIGWTRTAKFKLEVVNQKDEDAHALKEEQNTFNRAAPDYGFPKFLLLKVALDPTKGYIVDDTLIIRCKVEKAEPRRTAYSSTWAQYDSRKETGLVGLKNQGATCYMNSLLQTMFHLGQFRKAVYEMPTENDWDNAPEKSIPLALQRVFHQLQYSNNAVSTKQLTKSFGWDSLDAFTQHDVQELNRVLCDNLEGKMKNTRVEGTVERLFRGKVFNYIKCVNVDYESTREEAFYDLQLNVKGCADLVKSFEDYVEVEMLDGDNKYRAEGHGLQDAKKGVWLLELPPVLELQLKRFEYNPFQDAMCKINDKFVFPPEIDLAPYLAPDADRSVSSKYILFSVLVHSGDVYGGHYYAYVRPTTGPQWYKFDDDRVTKATPEQAMDQNFGGEERTTHVNFYGEKVTSVRKKFANAYMLVYIRDTDIDSILSPVEDEDIPAYLKEHFKREAEEEEQRKIEKAQAHLYATVRVVTDEDLRDEKRELGFPTCDGKEELFSCKLKRNLTLEDVKVEMIKEKELKVGPERIRFWTMAMRPNSTRRPDVPRKPSSVLETLSYSGVDVRLYAEIAPEDAPEDQLFTQEADKQALLFFKEYTPEAEKPRVTFMSSAYVDKSSTGQELAAMCRKLGGYADDAEVEVYEEEKMSTVNDIALDKTLHEQSIDSGDIIVFQKKCSSDAVPNPHAPDYYAHVLYRIEVDVYNLEKPEEKEFSLEMSKKDLYPQVAERIGEKVGWEPKNLRFTCFCNYYKRPYRVPVKYSETKTLREMLQSYHRAPVTPILYYEKLDVDLPTLETKKSLKIKWINSRSVMEQEVKVLVAKDAVIGGVKAVLREKLGFPECKKIRICDVYSNKIHRILPDTSTIYYFEEWTNLIASEVLPEEESNEDGRVMTVAHAEASGSVLYTHGVPFVFKAFDLEKFADTKKRLRERLPEELSDEEFEKYRFARVAYGKPTYLNDDDVLAATDYHSITYLGIIHKDTDPPKRATHRRAEVPIKIYN